MASSSNREKLWAALMGASNKPQYFSAANGMTITSIREGYAEGVLEVTKTSMDPSGCVHKGCLSTLMDNVAAMAAAGTGRNCVTLNCENHFLEPVRQPCQLIGEAHLISLREPMFVCRTAVRQGNKLIAIGTYTFYLQEELTDEWLNKR